MESYETILSKYLKQDLIEIYDTINVWKWDDRLGSKPDNWDDIPDYMMSDTYTLPTKYEIIKPITRYIKAHVKEKDLLKYHHLKNCDKTKFQHEVWWIKRQILKLLGVVGIGSYSRKNQEIFRQLLQEIGLNGQKEWVHKSYNPNK